MPQQPKNEPTALSGAKRRQAPNAVAPNTQSESVETLALQAYRCLRIDIIRGIRAPGERLRLEMLKSAYGIGPTPLREALQKLSADGLVHTEGNRGFTVAPLLVEEFDDLNTARIAIEKEALRLSIARGDDHWEAQLVAAHYLLSKEDRALPQARDRVPDSWEEANSAFHLAIVSACGSSWLLKIRASLVDLVERYRRASIYQELGQRQLAKEHSDILDAVLSRDAERACGLIESHFTLTAQILVEASGQKKSRSASRR
jgi:GntR family transcriptional regulator, carbon starvation induced regulator